MASLENVSTDDLREVLAEVEGKKPTQRLMAAINYLEEDDAVMTEVAGRYGYTGPDRLIRIAVVHYRIDRSTACGRPGK